MDLNTVSAVARPRERASLPVWQDGDAFLAGGTWLFSEPQPALSRLVDLASLGWTPLHASIEGLEIAATCTVAQLDAFSPPPEWIAASLFGRCCRAFLASFKIWNAATIGGNLCMALPAGPMIALTMAIDGVCSIWTPDGGERRVKAEDFVHGPQQNTLRAGEVLRRIDLPVEALMRRTAFRQISLAPLGRSGALLIGTQARDGNFALTITASTSRPVKLAFGALPSSGDLRAAIERAVPAWYDDVHGDPQWRRHVTLLLAEEIRGELGAGIAP